MSINIPGHTLIGRIDSNAILPGSGTHIYARNPALCKFLVAHSGCHYGPRIEILIIQFYDPIIIDILSTNVYIPVTTIPGVGILLSS